MDKKTVIKRMKSKRLGDMPDGDPFGNAAHRAVMRTAIQKTALRVLDGTTEAPIRKAKIPIYRGID